MTGAEFLAEFEQMMKMPPGSLEGKENLVDLPEWDSLQLLNFLVLVDRKLHVEINHEEVVKAETVGDLMTIVAPQLRP